jgi:hypothetical protein
MIKSRRMRWAGHVACLGDRRGAYRVFVGDPMERDHMEDLMIDGRIILKWMFKMWDGEAWAGLLWIRTGTGGEYM